MITSSWSIEIARNSIIIGFVIAFSLMISFLFWMKDYKYNVEAYEKRKKEYYELKPVVFLLPLSRIFSLIFPVTFLISLGK